MIILREVVCVSSPTEFKTALTFIVTDFVVSAFRYHFFEGLSFDSHLRKEFIFRCALGHLQKTFGIMDSDLGVMPSNFDDALVD